VRARLTLTQGAVVRGGAGRLGLAAVALLLAGVSFAVHAPTAIRAATNPCGPPVVSAIACENTLPGDQPGDWQVSGVGDSTIQGYASLMSVNVGQTVDFKINTNANGYHFDILRLGYYQGNGARKVASGLLPSARLPQSQPACLTNSTTGLIDCGNWGVSASWTVPSNAVSGVYLAHLVRNDNGGGSVIVFVVRNDSSTSDLLFQTSDTTWQAYNTYGGNSLYSCTVACPPGNPQGYKGAFKVSYNRPFHTPLDDGGRDWLFYTEYQMIRFIESNGYDVSYTSGYDVDSRGSLLLNHRVFMSTGHDEYWSANQRANVQAARDAGVNLAFFSGNESFWKTRWESSSDGLSTPGRTLVSYKETHFSARTDPQDPPIWTGTWRDPRFSPPADGGRPENGLTGQYFMVNSGTADILVPAQYGKLRIWRNTAAATLAPGQTLALGSGVGTLGYEWDLDIDNGFRPPGEFDLSSTAVGNTESFTQDYGTYTYAATETHHLSLYRAASGALVFGAGTVQWSWGLDVNNPFSVQPDLNMQQATVNLFADMRVQPFTLIAGVVPATASTDNVAPTSTITSPAPGANLAEGSQATVTGGATDSGGGVVAGVEVSTDGGLTWHPASGTSSWSYSWIVRGSPTATVMSRAVDDTGNIESPTATVSVNIACPCTLFGVGTPAVADAGDVSAINVGVKFTSDAFGTVSGVRFYKAGTNTGTHIGQLYDASGNLLASATFTSETTSGWQQVNFSSPVAIYPNTTYVAAYFAPRGHYSDDGGYFFPPPKPQGLGVVDSPPLHAPRQTGSAVNGLYDYGSAPAFPTSNYQADNYWVDLVFSPSPPPGQVTGVTANPGYASAGVTWTAPVGGGPVTAYTVTPYIGTVAQPSTTVTGLPAPTGTTVTGLTNGTTYTFRVTASNPNGSGPPSSPSNAVAPSQTASVLVNGGFEFGLSPWASAGVAPPATSTAKAHGGSASALLGVTSGSEPLGDSNLSQTLTVPSGTSSLTFWYWPATLDATCSGADCVWDWQEAQIRSTSGATLASVLKGNSNAQTWTSVNFNTSPWAGQTVVLWFNVHMDAGSDNTWMYLDDISLNASGSTVPGAPTNVIATAGNAAATVAWTAPSSGGSPITSYTITPYIGLAAQPATTVAGSPPATSATVTGLTNGTTYTFTVSATNSVGTGLPSSPSNAVTPAALAAPGAPTNVTATAGNAVATVAWTAPSNGGSPITSYTITPYIGMAAQTATTVTGSPPATSATVTGLTNGTTYTFTVSATNSVGTGPASSASNAVTPAAPTVPGAPTNITATAGNAVATVAWTAPSSGGSPITSYTITPYIGMAAQTATTVTGSPPATTATVTGLTNGTLYTFTVSATNVIGTGPTSSPSNAVTPATVPGAPANVSASAASGSATVSWSAPADGGSSILSYTVTPYVGSTAQPATSVTGSPPATVATVTGLTNGTTYTFTVAATNGLGTGPASGASNPVTPLSVPGAPANVLASAGDSSATVSWTAPNNGGSAITSYTVTPYIGSLAQTPLVVSGSPPATTVQVTGLTNGTTYTFFVSATNAVGTGPLSASSNAVTPALVVAPRFVQQASSHAASVGSIAATTPSNVTAGDRIVVLVGVWAKPTQTAKSVVDTAGNTYVEVLHFTANDRTEMSVWTAPIIRGGGGPLTVTTTSTNQADVGMSVLEYTGLSTATGMAAVDVTSHASAKTGGAGGTVSSGATPATTASNELAIGFYVDSGFGDTLTAGVGFTSRVNISPTSDIEFVVEDQVVGASATPSATFGTGPTTVWLGATVVFKHA
jgi:hypothetical protein